MGRLYTDTIGGCVVGSGDALVVRCGSRRSWQAPGILRGTFTLRPDVRSDVHTLFDRGYVTVTPELRFLVSKRIREEFEFENGRDYYALQGTEVQLLRKRELAPSREYLDWHATNVFRG